MKMRTRPVTAVLVLFWLALAPAIARAVPDRGAMIGAYLREPTADRLRYIDLIIPMQKLGPFDFTLRPEDVRLYLGDPDSVFYRDRTYSLKNLPDRYYFVYNAVGVSFLFGGGELVEMTAISPRFKFPNGLGVGSTEADVIAAFGAGFARVEGESQDTLVYAEYGVSFRVGRPKRIVWEIVLVQGHGQSAPAPTFEDLLNREVPKLDLAKTTLADLARLFGEPSVYRWGNKTYTRETLPAYSVAEFRNGFTALLQGTAVVELGFRQPGFKFAARLGVGSTLAEAAAVLGEPSDTVQGASRNFKSGVLYVNMAGERGACYYERVEWGVRLFFKDFKVSALYLTAPQ